MKRLLIPLLTLALLLNTGCYAAAEPALPEGAIVVYEVVSPCSSDTGIVRRGYDLNGDPSTREVITFSPIGRTGERKPVLWSYFSPDDPSRIAHKMFLTLPGRPAESVTIEQVNERYPNGPCDILQEAGQSG